MAFLERRVHIVLLLIIDCRCVRRHISDGCSAKIINDPLHGVIDCTVFGKYVMNSEAKPVAHLSKIRV